METHEVVSDSGIWTTILLVVSDSDGMLST